MSLRAMTAVWRDAPYSGGVLLVILALADWADDDGLCWPGVEAIAHKARLGARQVQKILSQLRRDGFLKIEAPGGGRGVVTHYRITLNCDSVNSDSVNSGTLNSSSKKPCPAVRKTLNSSSQKGEFSCNAIRKNRQDTSRTTKRTVRGSRPTLEQVRAYCEERKNHVDPEQWMNHYESNGWKVGPNPMADWKSAVRTWEKKNFGNNGNGKVNRAEQRQADNLAALNAAFPLGR